MDAWRHAVIQGNLFFRPECSFSKCTTIAGYTAYWYPDKHNVRIELTLLDGKRKSLGKIGYDEATALLTMLGKDGKKSTSYMEGKYIQVSEFYQFK